MNALVCLETVAAIPVTTAFHQRGRPLDVLFDEYLVAEEEANADYGQDDVDLGTKYAGLLKDGLVCRDCLVLRNTTMSDGLETYLRDVIYLVPNTRPEFRPLAPGSLYLGLSSRLHCLVLFLLYRLKLFLIVCFQLVIQLLIPW